jgi:hypothetical protein
MPLDALHTVNVIEVMENYIEKIRPPVHIRHQVDISYKIEGQSVIVFEIRPRWNNPKELQECHIAKTSYVKSKNCWKIFWLRANLKWFSYTPNPEVTTLQEFIKIIEKDKHSCFWG